LSPNEVAVPLTERQLRGWIAEHPQWRVSGEALVRDLTVRDFDAALGLVEQVARAVDDHGRRPDMCISEFNRVQLRVANPHHAGLTQAELRLAQAAGVVLDRHPQAQSAV
jgi:pterin-4a-carbinolamine dehydratase